jgi:saccharopine dehydrogenase (NAD+, L-lysine-forming)
MDAAGTRATERRAPVAPADARRLVQSGVVVTVEESPQRAFKLVVAPRDG